MTQMGTDSKGTDVSSGESAVGSPTRDPETFAIIGAAMEVHRRLGPGFLEAVYQEALALELTIRDVPHRREVEFPIEYREMRLSNVYRADLVCFESIIVELKALASLTSLDQAQMINYLKAAKLRRGMLINFGARRLEYKRVVL
jgi:GxxExxY protein